MNRSQHVRSKQQQSTALSLNPKSKGLKWDGEKLRWYLVPWDALEEIVKVITLGARKYAPNNWKQVVPFRERYYSALIRHLVAWQKGEKIDPETGYNHLAHAGCNLLFLIWGDLHGK